MASPVLLGKHTAVQKERVALLALTLAILKKLSHEAVEKMKAYLLKL